MNIERGLALFLLFTPAARLAASTTSEVVPLSEVRHMALAYKCGQLAELQRLAEAAGAPPIQEGLAAAATMECAGIEMLINGEPGK